MSTPGRIGSAAQRLATLARYQPLFDLQQKRVIGRPGEWDWEPYDIVALATVAAEAVVFGTDGQLRSGIPREQLEQTLARASSWAC